MSPKTAHAGEPANSGAQDFSLRPLLLVLAAAAVAGASALGNGFVFDDRTAIVENPKVLRADLRGIWSGPSWFPDKGDQGWRPLTTSSFALQWRLHGGDPRPFRAANLLLHALCALAVLLLARELGAPGHAPLLAALLFALHPIHSEVLNPVVGRADLLATLAVLWGCRSYLRGRADLSALSLGLGLLAKESAAALLLLAPLLEYALRRKQRSSNPEAPSSGKSGQRAAVLNARIPARTGETARAPALDGRWTAVAGRFALLGAGLFFALALRKAVVGAWAPVGDAVSALDNPLAPLGPFARGSNALYVLAKYLRLLLLPWPLSADYSFDSIPALGAFSLRNGSSILALAALAWVLRRAAKSRPEIPFCSGFFLLSFLPASNLVFPIGTIMAERLMYLPSAGFCILAGALLNRAGRAALPLSLAVFTGYAGLCTARNMDWKDDRTIFLSTLKTSPRSAKAMGNAAQALLGQGFFAQARDLDLRVIGLVDQFPLPYSNLGLAYMGLGDFEEARKAFEKALERDPGYAEAWVNLGILFARTRRFDGAVTCFEKALALVPADAHPRLPAKLRNNLGLALKQRGESLYRTGDKKEARASFARSRREYERALAVDPSYEDARRNYESLRPWLSR